MVWNKVDFSCPQESGTHNLSFHEQKNSARFDGNKKCRRTHKDARGGAVRPALDAPFSGRPVHPRVRWGVLGQGRSVFLFFTAERSSSHRLFLSQDRGRRSVLRVLGVEHKATLKEKRKFGTNSYCVSRTTTNGAHCSVEVNIVSYYQGLTRRARLPRNIPSPMFDIDHVFWEKDAVLNTMPKCYTVREEGRSGRISLSHVLDRCMQRKLRPPTPCPDAAPRPLC